MDCHLLSHGISIEKDSLHDCCLMRDVGSAGNPFIISINEDKTVDWEKVFEFKKTQKNSKLQNPKDCLGCFALTSENNFDNDEDYISYINFNHWNICNSRCIYCSSNYFGGDKYFNVYPLIKSLIDTGKFNNSGEITFQGGEPTVLPEFEELLRLFSEQGIKIRIHSSGIKYSKAIEEGLQKGLVFVVISPDSAISETYEKIKRVKCFDKVWTNLENYIAKGQNPNNVKAKFIIIPGINDTIEEIDTFIKKSQDIGLINLIWEVEGIYAGRYGYDVPNVSTLIKYAVARTLEQGMNYEFYDNAVYCMKKFEEENFKTENISLLKKEYFELREKYKERNIDYI